MPSIEWTAPEAKSGDLIYTDYAVFSYPRGKHVGRISPSNMYGGLCSDKNGNVYIVDYHGGSSTTIYEYVHGGTTPNASLVEEGGGFGCAIDTTTGNLAVTNTKSVAIFAKAQGVPTYYEASDFLFYCTYDTSGNLFISTYKTYKPPKILELPSGSSTFIDITIDEQVVITSLQWKNGELIAAGWGPGSSPDMRLYRISTAGSQGTIVGNTTLRTHHDLDSIGGQYLVVGKTAIGPYSRGVAGGMAMWPYPKGGTPKKKFPRDGDVGGLAFSVAPSH
jgi:hypothetical protein